jgi:hypothetical protein
LIIPDLFDYREPAFRFYTFDRTAGEGISKPEVDKVASFCSFPSEGDILGCALLNRFEVEGYWLLSWYSPNHITIQVGNFLRGMGQIFGFFLRDA